MGGPAVADDLLVSWNDGPALASIREFVARVTDDGSPDLVAPRSGWPCSTTTARCGARSRCRSSSGSSSGGWPPWPDGNPKLRDRQPWKAAYDRDDGWLGEVITRHYHGDDSDVKVLIGGVLQAFAGMDVQDYSGGDRDFMRPVAQRISGIPSERVIGSANALRYEPNEQGGSIVYLAEPDSFDDGPSRPGLRLLVLHDDPEREFDCVAGAERSLERARAQGWTVVSVGDDWATVFDDPADDDRG
jgi:hypothetical protein